jgi:hypothetical protein
VVAVPFLYLFSVPPVCIMTQVWGKPPSMDPFAPMPYLNSAYYRPYGWLHDHTPLRSGLSRYEEMWIEIL